jgi:flagellar biosynthesis/type III secretory pathway protein FliH
MLAIWCWVAVLTMSSNQLVTVVNNSRQLVVRPARVWQAVDLLHPVAPPGGFLPSKWRSEVVPQFDMVDFDSQSLRLLPSQPSLTTDGDSALATDIADAPDVEATPVPTPVATEAALAQARREGYEQGKQDAGSEMQGEMDRELARQLALDHALIKSVEAAIDALHQSPAVFFEPIKRLSLHLAEQLVLAELALDGRAIDRLVQRCVDELSLNDTSMVRVELSPSDLQVWRTLRERSGLSGGIDANIRANASLQPGSVRASANDALVDDLIGERLSALAQGLQIDEPRWRARSALVGDGASSVEQSASQVAWQQVSGGHTVEAQDVLVSGADDGV